MPKKPKDVKYVVIEALNSPKYKYRTALGVAKETHVPVDVVIKVFNSDNSVRKSLSRSKSGANLYTVKKKVSAVEDAWNAFRAINSAKFGS